MNLDGGSIHPLGAQPFLVVPIDNKAKITLNPHRKFFLTLENILRPRERTYRAWKAVSRCFINLLKRCTSKLFSPLLNVKMFTNDPIQRELGQR